MIADVSTRESFEESLLSHRIFHGDKPRRVEVSLEGVRQMSRWCLFTEYPDYRQIAHEIYWQGVPAVRRYFDGGVILGVPISFKPDYQLRDPAFFIS